MGTGLVLFHTLPMATCTMSSDAVPTLRITRPRLHRGHFAFLRGVIQGRLSLTTAGLIRRFTTLLSVYT